MSRRSIFAAMTVATTTIVVSAVFPVLVKLVWNASASVPIGLYTLNTSRALALGDLVAVLPDRALAGFMVRRGYIGHGVPLLKHVAALPGQRVCRQDHSVTVDGLRLGDALESDRLGRPLPIWKGCRTLAVGEIFLMNAAVRDSFDGRYFGPVQARSVIGIATPLLTQEAASDQFVWRAAAVPTIPDVTSISTQQKEYDHADR
ncbi:conjugative transfer signal peptidase TraF [Bosea sp. MMO-172]|uniref:conjugative transfer signal peptidase TraF n=1 Tax=Bosea sp. MMO-172 TaxID=3127885 RepID=UPI003018FB0A